MIFTLPVAVYQATAIFGQANDPAPESADGLIEPIRFALDLDRNAPGHRAFGEMIISAATKLKSLSDRLQSNVLVMSSIHRFDDACGDDNWLAVLAGQYQFNNGTYFSASPRADEANFVEGEEARRILGELVQQDWATKFGRITRLRSLHERGAREIGLMAGKQGCYLMIGDSVNGGRAIFWSVDAENGIRVAGVQASSERDCEIDEMVDEGRFPTLVGLGEVASQVFENLKFFVIDKLPPPPPLPSSLPTKTAEIAMEAIWTDDWMRAYEALVNEGGMDASDAYCWISQMQRHIRQDREMSASTRWAEGLSP